MTTTENGNGIKKAVETLEKDRDNIFSRLRETELEVAGMAKDIEILQGSVSNLTKDMSSIKNIAAMGTGAMVLLSFISPFLARWWFG